VPETQPVPDFVYKGVAQVVVSYVATWQSIIVENNAVLREREKRQERERGGRSKKISLQALQVHFLPTAESTRMSIREMFNPSDLMHGFASDT
jgi:hypothetical protein